MTTNNSINRRTDLLNVSPSGTGAGETGEVRFQELAANGTDYVALKAADSTATQTYTLPDAYPASNGQVLSSTTGGTMSWVTAGGGGGGGSLESLSDVSIVNPQPGQVLGYDSGTWKNKNAAAVSARRRLALFDGGMNAYLTPTSIAMEYDNWVDVLGNDALNGDGNIYNANSKVRIYDGGDAVSFSSKIGDSSRVRNYFARKADGTTIAWGINVNGELGLGTTGNTLTPTQIGSDTDWNRFYSCYVNSNGSVSLAIKDGGTLWAAGGNVSGITGQGVTTGNTTTFTQIGTDTDWDTASMVGGIIPGAAVYLTAVALKNDGSLWSWGANNFGLTGLGLTSGDTLTPTQIGSDTDWVKVWGMTGTLFSGSHPNITWSSCFVALKSNGTLWSWGDNANGFTAQGTMSGYTTTPTQVGTDTDWVDVVRYSNSPTSPTRITALKSNGELYCWGGGDSSGTALSTPTRLGTAIAQSIYPGRSSSYSIFKDLYGVTNKIELDNNTPADAVSTILAIDSREVVVIGIGEPGIITE